MDITTGYILGGMIVVGVGVITFAVRKSNQRYVEEMIRIEIDRKRRRDLEREDAKNLQKAKEYEEKKKHEAQHINRTTTENLARINQQNINIRNNNEVRHVQMNRRTDLRGPRGSQGPTGSPIKDRRTRDIRPIRERRVAQTSLTQATNNDDLDPVTSSIIYGNIVNHIQNTDASVPVFEGKGGTMDGAGASSDWDREPAKVYDNSSATVQTNSSYTAPVETTRTESTYTAPDTSSNTDTSSSSTDSTPSSD